MTPPVGLQVAVRDDCTHLVVTAESGPLRRELGPLAWSALEILVLNARPGADRRLVASAKARDLGDMLGVGRDAVAKALLGLRRLRLVATDERRGSGGRFAGTELVVLLPIEDTDAVVVERRRVSRPVLRRVAEPTLFDPPATRPDHQPIDNSSRQLTTERSPMATRAHPDRALTQLPEKAHTLALGMLDDAGEASC